MEHRCLAFSLAPSPQVRSLAQDPRILTFVDEVRGKGRYLIHLTD